MAKQDENIAFQELKAAIRGKQPGRLYIFHGEEMFLLQYYLQQLKKILVDELTESFNFHSFNSENFQLQTFVDSVESFPMMAEHTMVVVDDIDLFKLQEGERNKIAEVLSDIPEYCTVVFLYETVAWKVDGRYKKLSDAIAKYASVVEFQRQGQRELISWVSRHFAANKKQISNELCAYLIDITDGTMTSLSGEIEKICAYSGADAIHRSDIDAVTEPVLDAVIYQMTDLLTKGQYGQALQKLQQLLKMQEEPLGILGAIGNHFRRLSTAMTLAENGKNASELMKLYRITDYAARRTMDTARRLSPEFCRKAAALVLETDYQIKTSYDDKIRLLELLMLRLAQEARHD